MAETAASYMLFLYLPYKLTSKIVTHNVTKAQAGL